MEIGLLSIALMAIMAFVAGFLDSISGGGGLISLPSYLAFGLSPVYAIGNNKFSSTFGTLFATINYARKREIVWRIALLSALFALFGSFLGSYLAILFATDALMYVLLILLPFLLVIAFFMPKGGRRKEGKLSFKDRGAFIKENRGAYLISMAFSFVIGSYDGFFGPGTGMFYVLFFTFLSLTPLEASATSKVINLSSNIAALITFMINGNIVYKVGIPCAILSILGNTLGSSFAMKHKTKIIKPLTIVVIILLWVKILYDLIKRV